MDNPFDTPLSGQADWDSGLGANFQAIERGYHVTERAGQAISSGQILTLNSGGFFFPYAPGSASVQPHAYSYMAAASGDSLTALAWGIVRSLDINSPAVPGQLLFSTASGFVSVATLGSPVGYGLSGRGILFNPAKPAAGGGGGGGYTPSVVARSLGINVTTTGVASFTMVASGLWGWNRRVRVNGLATLVEVKLFEDAGFSRQMYSTVSGGVSAANSFYDRAGFPFDTDSGTIYGTVKTFDSVGSLFIIADWEV